MSKVSDILKKKCWKTKNDKNKDLYILSMFEEDLIDLESQIRKAIGEEIKTLKKGFRKNPTVSEISYDEGHDKGIDEAIEKAEGKAI